MGSAAAALSTLGLPAFAQQAYPARPVKFIVPFPAGGPVDVTGRAVTQKLSQMWGQQALVAHPSVPAGTSLLHVPYKGSAPAMTDLLGGQVQLMFSDAPTALPHIKAGKVRAVAVASTRRSALLPDVLTIAESGLPGYEAYSWAAFVVPAGTPKDIVQRLSSDINKALSDAEFKKRLYEAGAEAMPTTLGVLGKMLHAEIEKWTKVVRTANIQVD